MNGNSIAIGEENALSTAFSTIARSTEATDRETFSGKIRVPRTIRFEGFRLFVVEWKSEIRGS